MVSKPFVLKTKHMKHYASHKTMNLQSMHILLKIKHISTKFVKDLLLKSAYFT